MTLRTTHAACPHDCPDTCSMQVTVETTEMGSRVVRIQGSEEHPTTRGVLCTKVSRYAERTYHPERVLRPMRRVGPKGSGRFEPMSWDAALEQIASRLKAIVAASGPEAVVPYSYAGTMGLVQGEGMAARFFHKLGASRLDRTICSSAGGVGLERAYGGKVGMHTLDFAASDVIVIWGSNSITSNLHFWTVAQDAKRRGATLICIDPRRTETAEKCHRHVALLPGTDGALALGLMREWIVGERIDHDYISRHVSGYDELREKAMRWTLERTAQVCGLQADDVRSLAAQMAGAKPLGIRLNYGMQRVHGGGNAVHLVALLPCLLGSWRQRGGGMLMSSSGWLTPFKREAQLQRVDLLAGRGPRIINMSTVKPPRRVQAAMLSARESKRSSSTTATRSRWRPSRRRW
jgi:anaerobic selenocysteine-containing dehydrogenase